METDVHGNVVLSKAEYEDLESKAAKFDCLQWSGVDNWSGYEYMWEMMKENFPEIYKREMGDYED